MAKEIKRRRVWTDEQKENLIIATAGKSLEERRAILKANNANEAWWRKMRDRFMKANPHFQLLSDPAEATQALSEAPLRTITLDRSSVKFLDADEATQKLLIAEYDALPNFTGAKVAWLKAHDITGPNFHWHRSKLLRGDPRSHHKKLGRPPGSGNKKTSTALSVRETINGTKDSAAVKGQALLAEYQALPQIGGFRKVFLEKHGLNHANMHDLKRGKVLRKLLDPIQGKKSAIASIPEVLPPAHPPASLEDAIRAFELERDHLTSTIDRLKRMQRGDFRL